MNTIIEIESVKALRVLIQRDLRVANKNGLTRGNTFDTVQKFAQFLSVYEPFEIVDLKIQLLKNEAYAFEILQCINEINSYCKAVTQDSRVLNFFELLMADSSS